MKDICAVSTPLAEGGISVIRISGENAISIGAKVFKPLSCKSVENMAGYSCAYGKIVDKNGREVDDGVLTVFRAPRSYTGENVCEISCHGGIYVTKKVLRLCIEQGAELAQRGEFTKRAFLNGKLSLTQAEGVMETISAQGEYALNSANLTKEGRLFRLISDMSRKFVTILGELAAWVDYPEEDLPEISEDNLRESLKNALAGLDKIIADHDSGMILKNGVDTVIAGKPNVGKSTLMNMLLGYDRSIVTNVAGTTRDVIEESAKLGELILKLLTIFAVAALVVYSGVIIISQQAQIAQLRKESDAINKKITAAKQLNDEYTRLLSSDDEAEYMDCLLYTSDAADE